MKKISLLSLLLPLPAFAASFYPIIDGGSDKHVIESYPALGLVFVEEEGGFPNKTHTLFSEHNSSKNNQKQKVNSTNDWDFPPWDGFFPPPWDGGWNPPWDGFFPPPWDDYPPPWDDGGGGR